MRRTLAFLFAIILLATASTSSVSAGTPKALAFALDPASDLRWGGQLVTSLTVRNGAPRLYVVFHCWSALDGTFQQRGGTYVNVPTNQIVTVTSPAMPLTATTPAHPGRCNTRLYGLDRYGQPTGSLYLAVVWFSVAPA